MVSTFSLIALKLGKNALIALLCTQIILANLFVIKEIKLFGLTATASDALAVGASFTLNLIQEYFSSYNIYNAIWTSFFISIFSIFSYILHISYRGESYSIDNAFSMILTPMPRILIASLVTYIIVQHIECWLYKYLSCTLKNHHFIIRNYSSVALSQFIDTILFSFLGLYKATPSYSNISIIFQIILVSYTIKLLVIILTAPYLALSKKFMKL